MLLPVTSTQLACDCRAGAEVKADPDVGIVGAKHGHTLILRRVLDLVDDTNGSPSVCLVMFWVVGLFVMYQLPEFIVALPPAMVSHTLVLAAMR